jgi:hypothetical protein
MAAEIDTKRNPSCIVEDPSYGNHFKGAFLGNLLLHLQVLQF